MKRNLVLSSALLLTCSSVFAETIVVTASKIPTPLEQTANSVSVITAVQIENSSATDLPSLLEKVSGVSISQAGTSGAQASVFLRGSNSSDYILIVDGIQMNDPSQIGRSASLEHISLADIESIEVMKGSQSVLYGSDAAGGVIAITTKSASNKPIGGELSAASGTGKYYSGRAAVSGTISKMKYSLSSTVSGENAQSAAKGKNFDDDSQKYKNISGKIEGELFEDFNLKLLTSAYRDDVEVDDGSNTDDKMRTLFSKGLTAGAEAKYLYLDGAAEVTLSGDKTRFDRRDTDDVSPSNYRGETSHLALQNNLYLADHHTVATGFEYEREEDLSSSNKFSNSTLHTKSVYGLYQLSSNSLFGTSGIRLDHHSSFGKQYTYKIAPGYNFKSTGTKVFANHSTSFMSPSLFYLYNTWGAANEDLRPEVGYTSEIGVTQSLLELGQIELIAFYSKLRESIIYGPSFSYENGGEQVSKGLEAEYRFDHKKVSLSLNYALNNTKDRNGKMLLKRPKHSGSGSVVYTFSDSLNAGLDFSYKGSRTDYKSTTEDYKLGGHTLFGLSANYAPTKKLKLWAKVTNLFDKDYEDVKGYSSYGLGAKAGVKWSF